MKLQSVDVPADPTYGASHALAATLLIAGTLLVAFELSVLGGIASRCSLADGLKVMRDCLCGDLQADRAMLRKASQIIEQRRIEALFKLGRLWRVINIGILVADMASLLQGARGPNYWSSDDWAGIKLRICRHILCYSICIGGSNGLLKFGPGSIETFELCRGVWAIGSLLLTTACTPLVLAQHQFQAGFLRLMLSVMVFNSSSIQLGVHMFTMCTHCLHYSFAMSMAATVTCACGDVSIEHKSLKAYSVNEISITAISILLGWMVHSLLKHEVLLSLQSRNDHVAMGAVRAMLAGLCDCAVELDSDLRVQRPSMKFAAMLSAVQDSLQGTVFSSLLAESDDRSRFEDHVMKTLTEHHAVMSMPMRTERSTAFPTVVHVTLVGYGRAVPARLFHSCYTNVEGHVAHMIGICESSVDECCDSIVRSNAHLRRADLRAPPDHADGVGELGSEQEDSEDELSSLSVSTRSSYTSTGACPRAIFDAFDAKVPFYTRNAVWLQHCGSTMDSLQELLGADVTERFINWCQPLVLRATYGSWTPDAVCRERFARVRFIMTDKVYQCTVTLTLGDPLIGHKHDRLADTNSYFATISLESFRQVNVGFLARRLQEPEPTE